MSPSNLNIIIEAKADMKVINITKGRVFKLKEKMKEDKKIKTSDDVIFDILKQMGSSLFKFYPNFL